MSGSRPLEIAVATVKRHVRELDADVVDPAAAEAMVGVFAELERVAAAGKALYAARVATSGRWQDRGARSPADWLARESGSTVGAARGAIEVGSKLAPGSATDDAVRSGALSMVQAEAIVDAVAVAPDAEDSLLGVAQHQSLGKLRDRCAEVRAAAEPDPGARHERIRRSRSLRFWTDADGARRGALHGPAEAVAAVERALQPFADAAFEQARRSGAHESSDAYALDGLVAMAKAGSDEPCGVKRKARNEAIVIVNLESLLHDDVGPGETCVIPGVGPVPVPVARALLTDAVLRIVVRDGHDVLTEVHAGRLASDAQRIAIQVRQHGRCLRPTCSLPIDEIDHLQGFPVTGAVALDELGGLCRFDHLGKTHHGHSYRRGERGWQWRRPDGTLEYERPPPVGAPP